MNMGKENHPEFGMCEPIPSAKYWNDPRSVEGRRRQFAWCGKCAATCDWIFPFFRIPTDAADGVSAPVCRDCGLSMGAEELLEQVVRKDAWLVQFYPRVGRGGEIVYFRPIDHDFTLDVLMKWMANRKPGEDAFRTYSRLGMR